MNLIYTIHTPSAVCIFFMFHHGEESAGSFIQNLLAPSAFQADERTCISILFHLIFPVHLS